MCSNMELNSRFIHDELEYLVSTLDYPFAIKSNVSNNMTYLCEVEVNEKGYLTCYMQHVDDYYYVSDRITCLPSAEPHSWLDNLWFKNDSGEWMLFKTYLVHKFGTNIIKTLKNGELVIQIK